MNPGSGAPWATRALQPLARLNSESGNRHALTRHTHRVAARRPSNLASGLNLTEEK
jgi:hypothetical protein